LPLASPSIRAGVNQTIMLNLGMLVVESLIGRKDLMKMSLKRFNMPMLVKALWQVLLFCFVQ
jgi:ABC-type proline/glycine betaine transport system permease subunit